MSKYITHFQTEAEYQTALPSLDLPNVSLVDELGEVHYHRALYGAHAGDIALYDVANAQKIVVTAEDWNLTTYPTASYPIIGVVVADESAEGCKVISTLGMNADGSVSTTETEVKAYIDNMGFSNNTAASNGDEAKGIYNGKSDTINFINTISSYDNSHSTDNLTNCLGGAISLFHVPGTTAGDWYIPSCGEYKKCQINYTAINNAFTKIKNADSSLAVNFGGYKSYFSVTVNNTRQSFYSYTFATDMAAAYGFANGKAKIRQFTII